mmetsp:Transcript_12322/g.18589  ORF Transcript_12322/g.18589 Transcript_12322/m.18589 type:complete len:146 (-) Transcript_12322:761-1198(-)
MIYGFYLYSRTGLCLFHLELVKYNGLSDQEEHKRFLFGLLRTFKNFSHFVSHEPQDNIVRVISTTSFRLHVCMTATGLRFAILSSLETPRLDQTLSYLYQLYVEYVAKNPLYTIGTVIHCDRYYKEVKRHLTGEVYNFNASKYAK